MGLSTTGHRVLAPELLGSAAYLDSGTDTGQLPTVPLPMVVMPVAKARLDVHLFSQNLGFPMSKGGTFDLTGLSGLSGFQGVRAYQSSVPGSGKGFRTDCAVMEQLSIVAVIVNDTTLRFHWTAPCFVGGNFNFVYQIRN